VEIEREIAFDNNSFIHLDAVTATTTAVAIILLI